MKREDVTTYLDAVENMAGKRWLHDQVHYIRSTDPRLEIGASPALAKVHPLAQAWLKAKEEGMLAEMTESATFSKSTCSVAELGRDLMMTSGLAGFPAQKKRLLEPVSFRSAAFETAVAAGYAGQGLEVSFLAPGLEVALPEGLVRADCFAVEGDQAGSTASVHQFISGKILTAAPQGPFLAYFELAGGQALFKQYLNSHKEELGRMTCPQNKYSALIITCRDPAALSGRPFPCSTSVVLKNPGPCFALPEGFAIYRPA